MDDRIAVGERLGGLPELRDVCEQEVRHRFGGPDEVDREDVVAVAYEVGDDEPAGLSTRSGDDDSHGRNVTPRPRPSRA